MIFHDVYSPKNGESGGKARLVGKSAKTSNGIRGDKEGPRCVWDTELESHVLMVRSGVMKLQLDYLDDIIDGTAFPDKERSKSIRESRRNKGTVDKDDDTEEVENAVYEDDVGGQRRRPRRYRRTTR